MDFKPIQYHLEIYLPNNSVDAGALLFSSTPFPAFAVGDLIARNRLQSLGGHPDGLLKVTGIQHIIAEAGDHISHRVCVYTRGCDEEPAATPGLAQV